MAIKLTEKIWTQIEGDINPGAYGCTLARRDGECIELIKIQPTREYVGDTEAIKIGFPFWSRVVRFHPDDLDESLTEVQNALNFVGVTSEDLTKMFGADRYAALVFIANACLDYGHFCEEGPCGFAKDVIGDSRVRWYGSTRAKGWRYLADEDQEFRNLIRKGAQ